MLLDLETPPSMMICHTFLESVYLSGLDQKIFRELLAKYARSETPLDLLKEYFLSSRHGVMNIPKGHNGAVSSSFWWDAPFGLMLCRKNRVIAGIAFMPDGDALRIQQIQGLPGAQPELLPVRWELLLVRLLCRLAEETSPFKAVRIIRTDDCKYYRECTDSPADMELRQRLRRRYDGTARTLRFRFNKEFWWWEYKF